MLYDVEIESIHTLEEEERLLPRPVNFSDNSLLTQDNSSISPTNFETVTQKTMTFKEKVEPKLLECFKNFKTWHIALMIALSM